MIVGRQTVWWPLAGPNAGGAPRCSGSCCLAGQLLGLLAIYWLHWLFWPRLNALGSKWVEWAGRGQQRTIITNNIETDKLFVSLGWSEKKKKITAGRKFSLKYWSWGALGRLLSNKQNPLMNRLCIAWETLIQLQKKNWLQIEFHIFYMQMPVLINKLAQRNVRYLEEHLNWWDCKPRKSLTITYLKLTYFALSLHFSWNPKIASKFNRIVY